MSGREETKNRLTKTNHKGLIHKSYMNHHVSQIRLTLPIQKAREAKKYIIENALFAAHQRVHFRWLEINENEIYLKIFIRFDNFIVAYEKALSELLYHWEQFLSFGMDEVAEVLLYVEGLNRYCFECTPEMLLMLKKIQPSIPGISFDIAPKDDSNEAIEPSENHILYFFADSLDASLCSKLVHLIEVKFNFYNVNFSKQMNGYTATIRDKKDYKWDEVFNIMADFIEENQYFFQLKNIRICYGINYDNIYSTEVGCEFINRLIALNIGLLVEIGDLPA